MNTSEQKRFEKNSLEDSPPDYFEEIPGIEIGPEEYLILCEVELENVFSAVIDY